MTKSSVYVVSVKYYGREESPIARLEKAFYSENDAKKYVEEEKNKYKNIWVCYDIVEMEVK